MRLSIKLPRWQGLPAGYRTTIEQLNIIRGAKHKMGINFTQRANAGEYINLFHNHPLLYNMTRFSPIPVTIIIKTCSSDMLPCILFSNECFTKNATCVYVIDYVGYMKYWNHSAMFFWHASMSSVFKWVFYEECFHGVPILHHVFINQRFVMGLHIVRMVSTN